LILDGVILTSNLEKEKETPFLSLDHVAPLELLMDIRLFESVKKDNRFME
jgi:hypothetical protein